VILVPSISWVFRLRATLPALAVRWLTSCLCLELDTGVSLTRRIDPSSRPNRAVHFSADRSELVFIFQLSPRAHGPIDSPRSKDRLRRAGLDSPSDVRPGIWLWTRRARVRRHLYLHSGGRPQHQGSRGPLHAWRLGPVEHSRQEEGGQNRNDGDHHQKFDQSKTERAEGAATE
jgi:hypothetical protein